MSEPDYIAQTFAIQHTASDMAALDWWRSRADEAKARGCTFPRYTSDFFPARTRRGVEEREGLLFEAWIVRPEDQGKPRWKLPIRAAKGEAK